MSKLLMDESPLLVLPGLAQRAGLNEAIILQQLHWVSRSVGGRTVELDGWRWCRAPMSYWQSQFPFWSEPTIKRAFASLRQKGLVYVQRGTESNVYAINYPALDALVTDQNDLSPRSDRPVPGGQNDPTSRRGTEETKEEEVLSVPDDTSPAEHLPGMEPPPPPAPPATPWDSPDAQQEIWDHFVTTFHPRQTNLSPSRRRLIAKGLKETWDDQEPNGGIEQCKRAITGLKSWRQEHPGDETLSAIFTTRPNGSALGDQIEFFASQVGSQPLLDPSVPSVHRERITRRRVQVVEMLREPNAVALRERGVAALEWLRAHAKEEPVIENGEVTGWRAATTAGVAYMETLKDFEGFGP